jgi:hypothetical protein
MSATKFAEDLAAFKEYAVKRFDRVVGECVIGITDAIVPATPAQTGNARSNYFWGGFVGGETSTSISVDGQASLDRARTFAASVKAGKTIYMYNNVGYILDLEFGSSTKAPSGMARVLEAKWKQIGDEAVKRAVSK